MQIWLVMHFCGGELASGALLAREIPRSQELALEPDVSWPMSAGIGTRLIQCGSPTPNTKLNCAPTAPNYSGAVAFEFVRDTHYHSFDMMRAHIICSRSLS